MRLMDTTGEEFEGLPVGPDLVLVRGCLGGRRPEVLRIDALLEQARPLPERRHTTRRFARADRRRHPRNDRRGAGYTWLEQLGRRRSDVFSLADDRRAAEELAQVRTRLRLG